MSAVTVHILLATYNGSEFLEEQLQSLARQTHTSWTLTVSDDGSTDDTRAIVEVFSRRVPQMVHSLKGPCTGSTRNFFHLLHHLLSPNKFDLVAFCDQDDVWSDDKLARAVEWHSHHIQHAGRLYCGKTQYVNAQLRPLGRSPSLKRLPCFENALVQNIASGNTMVMDTTVLHGLLKVSPEHSVWHDWTTYLVTTAMGGIIGFDETPCVLYRQHHANVIGSNDGLAAQLKRLVPVWRGRYRIWSDTNLAALQDLGELLTPQALLCLRDFQSMRHEPHRVKRLKLWMRSNIRRQGLMSNASLLAALMFNRV